MNAFIDTQIYGAYGEEADWPREGDDVETGDGHGGGYRLRGVGREAKGGDGVGHENHVNILVWLRMNEE